MTDVFISYAHEDQHFVRRMVSALEAEGFSVWWDHTIPPGKTWNTFIARGIEEAKACIVVWSSHSVESKWVLEEATLANDAEKLLPVQIGAATPPMGFRRLQAAQLGRWSGDTRDPQWALLIGEVRNLVNAAPALGLRQTRRGTRATPAPRTGRSRLLPLGLVGAAVAAIVVGFLLLRPPEPPSSAGDTAREVARSAPSATQDQAEIERLRREREDLLKQRDATERQRRMEAEASRAEVERLQRERDETPARQRAAIDIAAALPTVLTPSGPALSLRADIGGTSWTMQEAWPSLSRSSTIRFRSNGVFVYQTDSNQGRWSQEENTIRFNVNEYSYFEGVVSGSSMRGTMRNNGGLSGTWSASRN